MEDDNMTTYGTPAQDTPYLTPVSTPRRILYRANPVKLVRQQVPAKVQPSQDSSKISASKEEPINAFHNINPMLTKRNKCTVQISSLSSSISSADGVGDQILVEIPERLNCENLVAQRLEFDEVACKSNRHESILQTELNAQDLRLQTNQRTTPCNSQGYTKTVEPNVSSQIKSIERAVVVNDMFSDCDSNTKSNRIINRNSYEEGMEQVALVEKEIQTLNKKIKEGISSLRKNQSVAVNAEADRNFVDDNEEKLRHLDRIVKKSAQAVQKKIISNRENRENIDAGHKCEKKKFYDPKDIRKYMVKKKNERLAKEKEEKTKKANEIAALKRKTEANKLFSNRTRLHESGIKEMITSKDKSSKTIKSGEVIPNDQDPGSTFVCTNKNFGDSRRSNSSVKYKTESIGDNTHVERDIDTIRDTELNFKRCGELIENCTKEACKSAKLLNNSKRDVTGDLTNENYQTSSFSKSNEHEDSKKRQRLDSPAVQREYDNIGLAHLKPELTLSDLNINETYQIYDTQKKSDSTFVVPNFESHRKPTKAIRLTADTKENLNSSLELSGIKPLPSFKPFVSTPLTEKNTNSVDQCEEVSNKFGSSLEKKYSEEENADKLTRKSLELHQKAIENDLKKVMSLESLKAQDISSMLSKSYRSDEICRKSMGNFVNVTLFDDKNERGRNVGAANALETDVETKDNNFSICLSEEQHQMNSSTVLIDLYDQMIKNEDEKLIQIIKKIQQQKEALNKYLRSEVIALELQKNQHRENKDEEKIKTIKKKQRGILLKVTKNIIELDKMKKSVIETVEKRKSELLKQKISAKEGKMLLGIKSPVKEVEMNRTVLISKQTTNTVFGFSSSSCTSLILENENVVEKNSNTNRLPDKRAEMGEFVRPRISLDANDYYDKNKDVKDSATSPVQFNAGISIRLDLDPEKLLQMKHPQAEIRIHTAKGADQSCNADNHAIDSKNKYVTAEIERSNELRDSNKSIKIKRPLSPAILPPSKKAWQNRRLSSSSEFTMPSFNDTTTTDQSDVEFRIVSLQEQLRQRKLEADRLRREEKQLRKEKLRSKEQSLLKQLEAYDQYIARITELLVQSENVIDAAAKPQIKQYPIVEGRDKRTSDDNDRLAGGGGVTLRRETTSSPRFEEVETNTEDSEKQLRKADSGILIESEVTEPSENADPKSKTVRSSTETTAIGQNNENAAASFRGDDVDVADTATKSSSSSSFDVRNFLQTVTDLHSEVQSLSEQLYSSDFVDEIPEDVPDTKSELSEGVTRTSSISIDEISGDYRANGSIDGDERSTKSSTDHRPLVFGIEDLETATESDDKQGAANVPSDKVEAVDQNETLTSDSIVVEDVGNLQSIEESNVDKSVNIEVSAASVGKNDMSDGEFGLSNVRNVSDIDSEDVTIREETTLSDGEIPDADALNSSSSRGLIKLNVGHPESEESDVIEIAEEVRPVEEVKTVMEGVRFSTTSATSAEVSKSSTTTTVNVKFTFDDVLQDLKSHFVSKKVAKLSKTNETTFVSQQPIVVDVDEIDKRSPVNVIERPRADISEETDISESLEYDVVPVMAFDDGDDRPIPTHPITDLDASEGGKTRNENSKESHVERDRSVEEFEEGYSIPNEFGSTFVVNDDELTFVGKMTTFNESDELADVSTPKCFRDDDDDEKEQVDEKNDENTVYEDLEQIDETKTPFLQALRRESENYFARRKESMAEKIVVDLLESLVEETSDLVASFSPKSTNSEIEIERILNAEPVDSQTTDEPENREDDFGKVDDSLDTDKNVEKLDSDWYNEKRLNYEESRLREAEELRLRQMKIEQEIEKLQAQQHIPPYVYLREIPNKPPPPYTPPTDSIATIPNNESELREFIGSTIDYVCDKIEKGIDIDDIVEPESTKIDPKSREVISYKRFLFDLTKEIAQNILKESEIPHCLPWEEPARKRIPKPKPKKADLAKSIDDEICVLFGYKSKINKENWLIQWSRKKRIDLVDDVLIKESTQEENQWTNYEKDELMIKNKITDNLLDDLIEDTVDSLKKASEQKK